MTYMHQILTKAVDPGALEPRPPLKRRLSLAEELAMVGEDSESGCQDETSEMASSASELEESDAESCNDSQDGISRGDESEEYSTHGESAGEGSAGEESAVDSGDDGDDGNKTLDALDTSGRSQPAVATTSRSQSRLPRFQPTARIMTH